MISHSFNREAESMLSLPNSHHGTYRKLSKGDYFLQIGPEYSASIN